VAHEGPEARHQLRRAALLRGQPLYVLPDGAQVLLGALQHLRLAQLLLLLQLAQPRELRHHGVQQPQALVLGDGQLGRHLTAG
jgi:hypothetical protein